MINKRATITLLSLILPIAILIGCSESSKGPAESIEQAIPIEKDKPFYFTLNSTKADSFNLSENVKQTGENIGGVNVFCEDDYTTLADWTMYTSKPNPFANTDFNVAVMSFNDRDSLQRVLFVKNANTEKYQNEIYQTLKTYLDNDYIVNSSPTFFSKNMTNTVLKSDNGDYYMGYAHQDVENYRVRDGYITLKKRLIGVAEAPDSIRPSNNGIYKEYANIGDDMPEWKEAPDGLEVMVDYFSDSYSDMYDEKCS